MLEEETRLDTFHQKFELISQIIKFAPDTSRGIVLKAVACWSVEACWLCEFHAAVGEQYHAFREQKQRWQENNTFAVNINISV